MIKIRCPEDFARLRRIALGAQGLVQARPFGSGLAGARKAISHLGYVQIDTISVVERAHHHVLYSRVPGFDTTMIDRMLLDRQIFEYWTHAAAFLPMADFRFSLPYKRAIRTGRAHWFRAPNKQLMAELLARVRAEGPVRCRDIEADPGRRGGWWDWKPAKKALEQLYMEGDLMVSDRGGFQKSYDLTERVLPADVNTTEPSMEEFASHEVEKQLRCHGVVSLKGMVYHQRIGSGLRTAVHALVRSQLEQGTLDQVVLPTGEAFVVRSEAFHRRLPPLNDRLRILSPFDNCLIQRERLRTIFGYEYQVECYLPESKRRYGYFCLPLLFGGEFVGRMDAKAHRREGHLELKAIHFEKRNADEDAILAALPEAISSFARFQGCESISVASCTPRRLTAAVRRCLRNL